MDRAVRHVKRQGGKLERLSVAVVLNTPTTMNEEGVVEDYSEAEIQRFTDLVKSVVGFNAARGDVVTIVSTKFEQSVPFADLKMEWYENAQIVSMIKSLIAALIAIALLFFVVRPAIKSYTEIPEIADETSYSMAEKIAEEMDIGAGKYPRKTAADVSLYDAKRKLEDKSTISPEFMDAARSYDDKVALIRLLVAKEPERVANVFKKLIR
jgi:flagellar M-ring protein FliF